MTGVVGIEEPPEGFREEWLEHDGELYGPEGVDRCAVEPVDPLPAWLERLWSCRCGTAYGVYRAGSSACFVPIVGGGYLYGEVDECPRCGARLRRVFAAGADVQLVLESRLVPDTP